MEDRRYLDLYNKFETYILNNGDQLDVSTICQHTIELMTLVETYKGLSGQEKKDLVLRILLDVTKKHIDDAHLELIVVETIKYVVPAMIDTIVAFDKGKLHIHIKKCGKGLFSCIRK